MPKYIMLTTLTDQGLQRLRSHPERLRAVNKDVEELGVTVLPGGLVSVSSIS